MMLTKDRLNIILKIGLFALLVGQSVLFYTKSPEMSATFDLFRTIGKIVLPLTAVLVLMPTKVQKKLWPLFMVAGVILYTDSLYIFTQNKYAVEQVIEHAIKFGLPILYGLRFKMRDYQFAQGLKLLAALTFVGHGLFAMGWHFVPGGFIQMVQNVFGFNVEGARYFLMVVGIIDLIVAVMLFIPKADKYAVYYMIAWGFLTSMARVVGYFGYVPQDQFVEVYVFEMLWRWPHFLVPFYIYAYSILYNYISVSKTERSIYGLSISKSERANA